MPHIILRPYYLGWKNKLTDKSCSEYNLKRDIILGFMALIIMSSIFIVNTYILNLTRSNSLYFSVVPIKIIELLYHIFFFTLIFSNTVACISNIYSSENMSFLLRTPVSKLRLYLVKVLEMLYESSFMLAVFAIPTTLAFYLVLDLNINFFLRIILISIPLLIIPLGPAIFFGTLFVRFAAKFWKRGKFLLAMFLIAMGLSIYSLSSTLSSANEEGGAQALSSLISLYDSPSPIWLPSYWAAELTKEPLGTLIINTSLNWQLLYSAAILSLALGYLVFDYFALETRSFAESNGSSENDKRKEYELASNPEYVDPIRNLLEHFFKVLPLSQQHRAIVLKDLTSLMRDRSQSFQLLMFLAISSVYVIIFKFMSFALKSGGTAFELWRGTLASFNILFAGFILTALMTRLIYPSVSLEGKSFWILQSAPLNLKNLVKSKFNCWFPLSIFLASALLISGGLILKMSFLEILNQFVIALSLAYGCTGLAIGFGASFSSFQWESTSQLSTGLGTLFLFGASLLFVAIITVIGCASTMLIMVPALQGIIGPYLSLLLLFICSAISLGGSYLVSEIAQKKGAKALNGKVYR